MKDKILELAIGLNDGEKMRDFCPFCKATHEKTFVVRRNVFSIEYKCWRNKCGAHGKVITTSTSEGLPPTKLKVVKNSEILVEIPEELIQYLRETYGFTKEEIDKNNLTYIPDSKRLCLPLYDLYGRKFGTVHRAVPGSKYKIPKTLNFIPDKDKRQDLHFPRKSYGKIEELILVEDIFSAIKCSRIQPTAALLGTHISLERMEKLCKLTKKIVLVLDPDAIKESLAYSKKFSGLFDSIRVVQLSKDPKDSSMEELLYFIKGVK